MIGPVSIAAHAQHDEEAPSYAAEIAEELGLDDEGRAHVQAFLEISPLYEVIFDFMLDTATGEAHCVKVDLRDGEPFTRPYPGQQLQLF